MDVTKRLFFNEWKIVRLIGEGSYGKVYLASKNLFGETVYSAIKIITIPQNQSQVNEEIASGHTQQSVKRYFREIVDEWQKEITILNKLKGAQSIVIFEDFEIIEHDEEIKWDIVIRMEYLTPISDILRVKVFLYEDGLKLGIDLARALSYCSQEGIIHRDIKPENIFVSKYGDYKLGDFGIAKQIDMTVSMMSKKGTYLYMAPEVFKGDKYDKTVDIYSLGLVLYRLFNNNKLPFVPISKEFISFEDREKSLLRRISGEKMDSPINSSPTLSKIILKCCEFESKNRYQDPKILFSDLLSELRLTEQKANDILINILENKRTVTEIFEDKDKTVGIFNQYNSNGDNSNNEIRKSLDHENQIVNAHEEGDEEILDRQSSVSIEKTILQEKETRTSDSNQIPDEIALISKESVNGCDEVKEAYSEDKGLELVDTENSLYFSESITDDSESTICLVNEYIQNADNPNPIPVVVESVNVETKVFIASSDNNDLKPMHQSANYTKRTKSRIVRYIKACLLIVFVFLSIIKVSDYFGFIRQ